MERGTVDLQRPFDLQTTLESGQTYLWWRADGNDYEGAASDGWYVTTTRAAGEPAAVRVRQVGDRLEWVSTVDAESVLRHRLGLDDDLSAVRAAAPDDELVERAFDSYWGMRIVREPTFPCLISFICSAQMRVARIHGMQQRLRETFGETVELAGERYHAYPTPEALAAATESRLRDLSLGYRAPYVTESAEMVADGLDPESVRGDPYEDAREALTRYVGVGNKVADCVLLFALGYLQAIPLDTWIRKTIDEHYPDCDRGNYADTSRALRERLGGDVAGYTQTYIFHHLRSQT